MGLRRGKGISESTYNLPTFIAIQRHIEQCREGDVSTPSMKFLKQRLGNYGG